MELMMRPDIDARRSSSLVCWLAVVVWLGCAPLAGCGGGSQSTAGAGGGGSAGSGGAGRGAGGATGSGGSGIDAAAGGAPQSGSCAVPEGTADANDCTDFTPSGALLYVQRGIAGDGGIYVPGGDFIVPTGGTLVDGDYDLIQFYGNPDDFSTRRTIRLFGSGTYMEWSADNSNPPSDGGITHYRFNTTVTPQAGNMLKLVSSCILSALPYPLGYSANGDQLELIDFEAQSLFVYQRRCTR
jgi:hypothetical protein